MNDLVGIIRKADEITEALAKLDELRERFKNVTVEGDRQFNPGWHLAIDLRNMLLVSECVAKAALDAHREPRRTHPRRPPGDGRRLAQAPAGVPRRGRRRRWSRTSPSTREPQVPMRPDLLELFELDELEKYYTDDELADHPERRPTWCLQREHAGLARRRRPAAN